MANHNAQHQQNKNWEVPGTMGTPLNEPKPEVKPLPETSVRSWLVVRFDPFEPNDIGSSLHRKWIGHLFAKRSDGFAVHITIRTLQSDGPQRVGQDMVSAFERLQSYLECPCTKQKACNIHDETLTEPVDNGQ